MDLIKKKTIFNLVLDYKLENITDNLTIEGNKCYFPIASHK